MTVEPDESMEDELVRNIVAELRRPVALDPAIDARVLDIIHAQRSPDARRGWIASIAGAAIAAGVLLALYLGPRLPVPPRRARCCSASRRPRHGSSWSAISTTGARSPPPSAPAPAPASGRWSSASNWGRYHYSFLLDGRRWVSDPAEPRAAESDFGAPVSVLTVS